MINRLRQVLAKSSQPFKIEKPTTVIANMIAAEILMDNVEHTCGHNYFWEHKLKSDKFEIVLTSDNRYNLPLAPEDYARMKKYAANGSKSSSIPDFKSSNLGIKFIDADEKLMAMAFAKYVLFKHDQQMITERAAEEEKALKLIENWMGLAEKGKSDD